MNPRTSFARSLRFQRQQLSPRHPDVIRVAKACARTVYRVRNLRCVALACQAEHIPYSKAAMQALDNTPRDR